MRENDTKFLTVQEAARSLGVTAKSVRDFIAAGELRASKIGQWKIAAGDLEAFVQARTARRPSLLVTLDVKLVDRLDKMSALAEAIIDLIRRDGQAYEFAYQSQGGTATLRLTAPPEFLGKVLRILERFDPAPALQQAQMDLALDRE